MTTGILILPLQQMTEQELIAGCRSGRREAFDELVARHYDRIYRLAYALAGSERDQDLAQETFLSALRSFPTFRGESQVATWLISILRNQVSNFRRTERKWRMAPLEGEEDRLSAPPPREIEAGVRAILERMKELPDDLRWTLILFYIEGMRYAEIAQAMGCPIGTVRSRLFEARERLKACVR